MTGPPIVTRGQWAARAPRSPAAAIRPSAWALHWEGVTMGRFAHPSCGPRVRQIQSFHMDSRGWADIAYNFVVCPHGTILEGRGWDRRSAANGTNAANAAAMAVCYLGGPGDPFTTAAQDAITALIASRPLPVFPHSHYFRTDCPGPEIRAWIDAHGQEDDDMDKATRDQLERIERAVESILRGNFGEKPGFEPGDLTWLEAHTRKVVADVLHDHGLIPHEGR